jgi:hypothetical protein
MSGILLDVLMDPKSSPTPSPPSFSSPPSSSTFVPSTSYASHSYQLLCAAEEDGQVESERIVPTVDSAEEKLSLDVCTNPDTANSSVSSSSFPSLSDQSESKLHRQDSPMRKRCASMATLLAAIWQGPLKLVQLSLTDDDLNALHGMELSGQKRAAWSKAIDLARFKQVKNYFGGGCTINDVFISCMTGALNSFCQRSRRTATSDIIRIAVPFNMRNASQNRALLMENKFAIAFLELPLAADSPRARLVKTMKSMRSLKGSPIPLIMYAGTQFAVQCLPLGVGTAVVDSVFDICSCVMTNNRGPADYLSLGGARLDHWVSWAPSRAHVGLVITILTYANTLRVSVVTDHSVTRYPDQIVTDFETNFAQLAAITVS